MEILLESDITGEVSPKCMSTNADSAGFKLACLSMFGLIPLYSLLSYSGMPCDRYPRNWKIPCIIENV